MVPPPACQYTDRGDWPASQLALSRCDPVCFGGGPGPAPSGGPGPLCPSDWRLWYDNTCWIGRSVTRCMASSSATWPRSVISWRRWRPARSHAPSGCAATSSRPRGCSIRSGPEKTGSRQRYKVQLGDADVLALFGRLHDGSEFGSSMTRSASLPRHAGRCVLRGRGRQPDARRRGGAEPLRLPRLWLIEGGQSEQ